MYRVHGDKIIKRRTNYRKENDIQKYTKILKEDFGNMCGYCGKDFNIIKCPYQKDHLIPEDIAKKVGRLDLLTDYNNLVYSCRVCNRNKWDKWPFDNVDKIHDDRVGFVDPATDEFDESTECRYIEKAQASGRCSKESRRTGKTDCSGKNENESRTFL